MNLFIYLLQVSSCLAVIYAIYFFVFKKELFSQFNRFYLLLGIVLSFSLPFMPRFITVEAMPSWSETIINNQSVVNEPIEGAYSVAKLPNRTVSSNSIVNHEIIETTKKSIDWQVVLLSVYWIGVTFVFIKMLFNLIKIARQIQSCKAVKKQGYWVLKGDFKAVFSFFNYVFWNDKLPFSTTEREQILAHELVHIKDKHTIDILFLEVITAILWFNPVIYFYKKSLKNLHEYIADRFVFEELNYQSNYAQLLIKEVVLQQQVSMVHPFFNSLIKKRLVMLNQTKQSSRQWKLLVIAPVLSFLLLIFGVQTVVSAENSDNIFTKTESSAAVKKTQKSPTEKIKASENNIAGIIPETQKKAKEEPKEVKLSVTPPEKGLSPEWIAEIKRVESEPNPWFANRDQKALIQIDGNFPFLFKKDGSRKTPNELRAYVIEREAQKGNVYSAEQVTFYTNNQLTEWTGVDMESMKEVDEFETGRVKLTWTGIKNGQLNDLNKAENQRFKLWDTIGEEFIEVEEYNIYLTIGDKKQHKYSFKTPKSGNIFPSELFELMKQMKSGDKVILDSFKFRINGKVFFARDQYRFKVK
ncbi:MAG: M56 family metallopeptidase [Saprospiraceae bacterium]